MINLSIGLECGIKDVETRLRECLSSFKYINSIIYEARQMLGEGVDLDDDKYEDIFELLVQVENTLLAAEERALDCSAKLPLSIDYMSQYMGLVFRDVNSNGKVMKGANYKTSDYIVLEHMLSSFGEMLYLSMFGEKRRDKMNAICSTMLEEMRKLNEAVFNKVCDNIFILSVKVLHGNVSVELMREDIAKINAILSFEMRKIKTKLNSWRCEID